MSLVYSFRTARWIRSINLVLQAVLFLTLFSGLNYLALILNFGRFDLTRLRHHSLSAETRSYLAQLRQPVQVIVTLPKKSENPELEQAYTDVMDQLREYVYATAASTTARITVQHIDVYQRPADTRKLDLHPDTVLFLSGTHRHEVPLGELYRFKDKKRVAFLGEQAFTAAILDVSGPKQQKIYLLTGHGEMAITGPSSVSNDRGLSDLLDALRARNFAVETLNLNSTRQIPEDASLILSVGARTPYDPFEEELLRKFMTRDAGRLMLFFTPGISPSGLESLLFEWGILSDDVWVFDNAPGTQTDNGDLIFNTYWAHPITQILSDNELPLRFGATRTVRKNPSALSDPSLSVAPLIGASPTAWGERDYLRDRRYTPGADLRGDADHRLPVASVAERLAAKDNLPFSIPVGRLVAFGSSDFIANDRLPTNATLFFSALNWLVDRDAQLNVPARKIDKFQLSLSRQELLRLRYSVLFGLPAAAALLGLFVYWSRRR